MYVKKTKTDLNALFKLEFYRKQNNWKFCGQVHQKYKKEASKDKTKSSTVQHVDHSDKNNLNKTYNVDAVKSDERSDLNNAFAESGNDKNISTPPNSPSIPAKDWSPEFICTFDKWASQDLQTYAVPSELPAPENPILTHTENDYPKLDLNSPDSVQNWNENHQFKSHHIQENEKSDCNWPCQTSEDWLPGVKENQNALQEMYDRNVHQEIEFEPNWLQQRVTCRPNCINGKTSYYQDETNPYIDNCIQQSWANIALMQSIDKYADLNYNSPSADFTPTKPIAEPILVNCENWKEIQIPSNTFQNLPEVWQNGVMWQECLKELPEMDKGGYEGTEAGWPLEPQIRPNHKLFPEVGWSEDVLRELELLNAQELDPETPAPQTPAPGEKWVPPDRLLQWMLANKECCDDVLETSCESEEQFMRAAHCAPHSSEIDVRPQIEALETSLELECGNLITDAVGALSEAALLAAARAHAKALRRVATELRNREQRPHSTAYPAITYDASCEEYPTRDIGLHQPSFIDTFISGSHKNDPNIKTLDRPKENDVDQIVNYNQLSLKAGQIVVNRIDRQIKINRRSSLGQSDINNGQSGVNLGKTANQGQNCLSMGQTGLERGQINLEMGIDRNDLYRNGITDSCHVGISGQPGSFGDYNIIGRGRGRLPMIETQTIPGRGRGRI